MNAVLSIKIDLLEPAKVSSVADIVALDASQIREISICLNCLVDNGNRSVAAVVTSTDSTVQDLIFLAQTTQPEGTSIEIWFQGRSERIRI